MAVPQSADAELTRHQQYYHRFMLGVKWFGIHMAALIVLLTLWFCTPAGFGGGLFAALIVAAIGVFAMTHGLNQSSERPWPPERGGR